MDKADKARQGWDMKTHWAKTPLKVLGKASRDGSTVALDAGKLGKVLVKWTNKEPQTKVNLVENVIKRSQNGPWHVRWFEAVDGTKFATDILDDAQYERRKLAKWHNYKIIREGLATQNPWMS